MMIQNDPKSGIRFLPGQRVIGQRYLTRIKWKSEANYIFVTFGRKVNGEECDTLCERFLKKNQELTIPGEALLIDLRPAFEMPLASVTPHTVLPVPIDFNLPS
jgi:hypothetical protein